MAYSDYGGYAYKNRQRVVERSDAVLSPEGIKRTPGMWPGWTLEEGRSGVSFHVLLGDGPIFVGLFKQSSLSIHRLYEKLNPVDLMINPPDGSIESGEWDGKAYRYINVDFYKENNLPCELLCDDVKISIRFIEEENHYMFVRVEQPDGDVWHGWSGYGVGSGLKDCGYGFSTKLQEQRLWEFWPND